MGRITKTVVVIDEAQDMDENEFALIKALMNRNDDMRIIAVGDDDQNIYEFRGSNSKHLKELIEDYGAKKYEMTENYRSGKEFIKESKYEDFYTEEKETVLVSTIHKSKGREFDTRL